MRCFHPIRGYRAPGGRVSLSPIGSYIDRLIEIPCRQCIGCRLEHSRQWAVRIMHEATQHEQNSFLTLTYDDEHLPHNSSLNVRDWQLFAKRLRKSHGPFRFYHCGEYGERTKRPHLHACLFGLDFSNDRIHHSPNGGNTLYRSPGLDAVWQNGNAVIGALTFESAAYVASYVTKKITGPLAEDHYSTVNLTTGEITHRKPEYSTMSRRPGIGKKWLNEHSNQVYPRDEIIVRGHKAKPPKYYDVQMEQQSPEMIRKVKLLRGRASEAAASDQTPERRKVREACLTAKQNLYPKTI